MNNEEKTLEFKYINCKCGKPMEDTGKKVWYALRKEHDEDIAEFSLFACNWCGAQALFRELKDDECYEV